MVPSDHTRGSKGHGAPVPIALIAALDENRVIGHRGGMPWHLPGDLQYFQRITMGKPLVMGRKTFESIGRPLPGRTNIVVTRQRHWRVGGVAVVDSIEHGLALAERQALIDAAREVIVIGGADVFRAALPRATRLYLTYIRAAFEGDTFFPELCEGEWGEVERQDHLADRGNPYDHSYVVLDRVANEDVGNDR